MPTFVETEKYLRGEKNLPLWVSEHLKAAFKIYFFGKAARSSHQSNHKSLLINWEIWHMPLPLSCIEGIYKSMCSTLIQSMNQLSSESSTVVHSTAQLQCRWPCSKLQPSYAGWKSASGKQNISIHMGNAYWGKTQVVKNGLHKIIWEHRKRRKKNSVWIIVQLVQMFYLQKCCESHMLWTSHWS